MGHWMLEVAKIGIYVCLPLTSFLVFNHPKFYTPILYEWRSKIKPHSVNDELIMQRQLELPELDLGDDEEARSN